MGLDVLANGVPELRTAGREMSETLTRGEGPRDTAERLASVDLLVLFSILVALLGLDATRGTNTAERTVHAELSVESIAGIVERNDGIRREKRWKTPGLLDALDIGVAGDQATTRLKREDIGSGSVGSWDSQCRSGAAANGRRGVGSWLARELNTGEITGERHSRLCSSNVCTPVSTRRGGC